MFITASAMDFRISSRNILFLFFYLFCTFHFSIGNENTEAEGNKNVIDFKVNVRRLKREVQTVPSEELSPLEGRTHRASEPLDPNNPGPVANPFEGFETVNTVFNPSVEGGEEDEEDSLDIDREEEVVAKPQNAVQGESPAPAAEGEDINDGEPDNEADVSNDDDDIDDNNREERQYAAQFPYPQASREAETPQRFYPGDFDQPPYRSPDGSQVYRQQTFVVGQSGNVDRDRGYQSGNRQYVDNSRNRQEERGPPYNGQLFIDSQGHYVDAQGRHLDATGRYYDISGRYQDALITRTSNYYNAAPVYTHSSRGADNQYSQYAEGGTPSRSRGSPLDSYGGNQFYQTGSGRYPAAYDPVVSQISDDPNCQDMNVVVTINGLTCNNAVSQLGSYVCYNYERVSTECCQRCLQVKRREREGCEYGDRSNQCRNIQPFNCYDDRNRQICCDRCRQFLEQRGQGASVFHSREELITRCSYDDLTPRCQNIRQRPHLCYLPDNQRLCCSTCPRLANNAAPGCKWGDQSPEMCQPFDANRRLKLNCYIGAVQDICCATCKSLRDRMPQQIPGCQYGDAPTLFRTGRGLLNCGQFIRNYGVNQCNNYQTSTKCCYTCHRYRSRQQRN